MEIQMSSGQNLCWLMVIVDYTTLQILGQKSNWGIPFLTNQDSVEWEGILNIAQMGELRRLETLAETSINGRSAGSSQLAWYGKLYHMSGHIFWDYSLKYRR